MQGPRLPPPTQWCQVLSWPYPQMCRAPGGLEGGPGKPSSRWLASPMATLGHRATRETQAVPAAAGLADQKSTWTDVPKASFSSKAQPVAISPSAKPEQRGSGLCRRLSQDPASSDAMPQTPGRQQGTALHSKSHDDDSLGENRQQI